MVARERLVGDRVDEVRGPHRQVGVHVDAGAQTAVVPVVGGPRLARDERDAELLAVRRAEQTLPHATGTARRASRRRRAGDRPGSRSRHPTRPACPRRTRTWQERVQLGGGRVEHASSRRTGSQAKQPRTWSRYGSGSPASAACLRRQRDELRAEPVAAVGLPDLILEPSAESVSVVSESGWRPERLDVDVRLKIGRTVVGIDEPGDVLVEPEREQEVVAGDRVGNRDLALATNRERRRRRRSRPPARPAVCPCLGPARCRGPRRQTASPAARQRRGSSEAPRSWPPRPRGRRPPPRPASSAGRGRCPSACRPSATTRW